ncbi:NAD+ synthase [Halocalculus aciditolerans]|uniref:NH(3)-dependent NAD(+) synthetase n=1 Tax=Halocalculus aciditolerans TaxID=1383812 RepID=A0A830F827_9EURY|nr:NAD+ synthase [Halocalculus aciditolerans]GGL49658.1 NAD(+) synthetase [Halocalculus aciditolerans]
MTKDTETDPSAEPGQIETDPSVEPGQIEPVDLRFSEDELADVRDHLVSFIREQTDAAGVDEVVLGLSGGIDSSSTASLAVEALGAENVHGLVMPGAVSTEENMSDAEVLAEDLGISFDVVEINPFVNTLLDTFPEAEDDRLAVGNARARTRAVVNYLVANHQGAMVLGTGNRTEAAIGYFTKYGDGAVDCHPIGNLYKQQVRQLARDLGVREEFVTKTPTAGLWAGQTDEEEIGMDYDTLDAIIALHIDGHVPAEATARIADTTLENVEHVADLHAKSEHKRQVPPAPDPLF